jgi:hypothetical protein
MRKMIVTADLPLVLALGLSMLGCQSHSAEQNASHSAQQNAPKVKVGSALRAKANSPAVPATANNPTKKDSIGKGSTTVAASQPSSFWTEQLDVNDDGKDEISDFLYDAQRGVVYTYREDYFTCPNGNPASSGILEALYATGNPAGKPVGSGWYAVSLNAGQCNAKEARTFGCRFDTAGNPTECGAITINNATGEVDIADAQI